MGLNDHPFGEWFCDGCTTILLDSDSESGDDEQRSIPPETKGEADDVPSSCTRHPCSPHPLYPQPPPTSVTVTRTSDAVGARPGAHFVRSSRKNRLAGVSPASEWTLKGDVRGCRCPDCVSILLQSGGKCRAKAWNAISPRAMTLVAKSKYKLMAQKQGKSGSFRYRCYYRIEQRSRCCGPRKQHDSECFFCRSRSCYNNKSEIKAIDRSEGYDNKEPIHRYSCHHRMRRSEHIEHTYEPVPSELLLQYREAKSTTGFVLPCSSRLSTRK